MSVLKGVKVVELAGLAPGPYCGLILSDFGARVVRVDKLAGADTDNLTRGKLSVALDLKKSEGRGILKKMCSQADVVIEPYRPGVMEKLGLGPQDLLKDNPRLIYARLTGYGQAGSLAKKAGHDINYLAISGVLSKLGRSNENPTPPVNLLADFAGGGLMCAFGIVMALFQRTQTGRGQVVDSNMVESAAYIGSFLWKTQQNQMIWNRERGKNLLDGGAHFYDTFKTKDGKYMSVGAIEPQFYEDLLKGLNLSMDEAPHFGDFDQIKDVIAQRFLTKTRNEWSAIFQTLDGCVEPVLEFDEAAKHPHNSSKGTFLPDENNTFQPGPAPRLSDSERMTAAPPLPTRGQHSTQLLQEIGYSQAEIQKFLDERIVGQAEKVDSKL